MDKRIYLLVILLALTVSFHSVFAIRANPAPVEVTQPDGTKLTIRIHGDEFNHYRTTNDGYLLKENTNGYYIYDLSNSNLSDKSTQIIAKDASKRSTGEQQLLSSVPKADATVIFEAKQQRVKSAGMQRVTTINRAFPLTGSPKSLVILVNFSDKSYVVPTPQTAYTNLLNQSGYSTNGGTGSARDYFMAASSGKFAPQFDVVGPYTLPNTLDYYGKNDANDFDTNPQQMIIDACNQANINGIDFTQYDTDNDGMVDNIFVYYAGYNEAEGGPANTVWPHRWSLADYTTKFDGKIIYDYACTSELNSSSGSNMCGIGTFSHEFGHVLGLPDYYHTNDASGSKATLDYWHIMDAGAYNNKGRTPPTYTAFDRFYLGWFTPEQISTPIDLTLLPLFQGMTTPSGTSQQAYLLSATTHNMIGSNPSPAEFFVLEYRKKTGWDAFLPGEGLLIWHVDYDATAWSDNSPNNYTGSTQTTASHMRMYLQPLSGSTTTPGAAFTTGSFTPTTWSGTNINRAITSITKTTDNVTFKLMGGTPVPTLTTTGTLSLFSTYVNNPSSAQSFSVTGSLLSDNVSVTLSNPTHFDIKLSTDANWAKSLSIPLVSAAVNSNIQVRFNPGAEGTITTNIVVQSGSLSKTIEASGLAVIPPNPNAPVIQVGKIDSQLSFTATPLNITRTKTINIKTTDLAGNLTIAVTGANASMFNASVSSLTKETTNTLIGTTVNVTYKPTSVGQHTATLTISGGGLNPAKVITLTGQGK